MSWTDRRPPWLPPIPPPHPGRWLIVTGLIILAAAFVFILVMTVIGGTHTLYTLLAILVGLAFLLGGLLRRR
ncbi:hypothetical protein [Tersicoccus solisilvae]|uniref:hypothetical protein n=1 Tax=Tersicoccus solisilvae TaxID=1882339 RepID=UPI00166DAEDD|nr:hypothetical protein [Tersicoccus solisilvae]